MSDTLSLQLSYRDLTIAISGLIALVGGLWALLKRRQDLELSWAGRAEALWNEMQELHQDVDILKERLVQAEDALRWSTRLVVTLRTEIAQLRATIRAATDLADLQAHERQILTSPTDVQPPGGLPAMSGEIQDAR